MRAELKKKLILCLVFCPNTCFRIVFSFWMRNELVLTTTERLSSSIITINQCHVPGCILFLLTSIITLIVEPNWRSFYGNNALHSRASILFTESAQTPTKPYPKQFKEHDIGHCNGKVWWVITKSFSSRWYDSLCKSGSSLKVHLQTLVHQLPVIWPSHCGGFTKRQPWTKTGCCYHAWICRITRVMILYNSC